ncbi:MAG: hypothetical protein JMN27_16680 [gamma proteobacterium endosymbiont of Lamellibrachia anaximandri]|nr:hypothetical protein [gamma proteobacterium endosymbiont of Lamellibrachia anaximandri]MBL3535443.1 hypothetical protein [gamma proteobacterium endosymbiont of Lamellibrachia anaximandri]
MLLQATGCNTLQTGPAAVDNATTECLALFQQADALALQAATVDSGFARIPDFPWLRTNRFFAFLSNETLSTDSYAQWLSQLEQMDREARHIELSNADTDPSLEQQLHLCRTILSTELLGEREKQSQLQRIIKVNDDYSSLKRAIGLYPITAIFVDIVASNWRDKARLRLSGTSDRQSDEVSVSYIPPSGKTMSSDKVANILSKVTANPLKLPDVDGKELQQLLLNFAPIWVVDTEDDNDHIGTPRFDSTGNPPYIDTSRPVVYTYKSFTRWQSKNLLQLNYVIWFPARPLENRFDILGGHLDGLSFRVTLSPSGQPLLYDTIHNCGCYHTLFPTPALTFQPPSGAEPPLLVDTAPESSQRKEIRLTAGTHHIRKFDNAVNATLDLGKRYKLVDYQQLTTLPHTSGSRSLFSEDGIVQGTERGERWLLWPMGIASPGAMRQRGRHATAFVGRRHFDDPDLMETLFFPTKAD